ncbi:MAG: hypothetical protein KJN77_01975 [Gammaproteobacteria bacterium]|nr:hypothetical protein [Gammaproteobacteria bacterium]
MNLIKIVFLLAFVIGLAACGGDNAIDTSCDEPQRYQSVSAGKRIVVPEGLDPLNEFAEMPIPSAENVAERPKGSRCIEMPPSIGSGKN